MYEIRRALRRISGCYIPHLQPFWDEQDHAHVTGWLNGEQREDGRKLLLDELRNQFPQSHEIALTDSGKSALVTALKMLDIAEGSEVILPSYCCASVIAAVVHAGCEPVLADSGDSLNIDYESVEAALSPRTSAILVPHMFGLKAASLDPLIALGRDKCIAVIEDVAQAFGLRLEDGRLAGNHADAAIFSAGLGKPIMGPGGGWALINVPAKNQTALSDEPTGDLRQRVAGFMHKFTGSRVCRGCEEIRHSIRSRLQTRYGVKPDKNIKAWAKTECRNYRMSSIDAWLVSRQIARINDNIDARKKNALRWKELLAESKIPCTTLPEKMNIFSALPLIFKEKTGKDYGARFKNALEENGIATQPCYTPLHLRPHGQSFRRTDMSHIEALWQGLYTVPVRPNLDNKDWDHITDAVRRIARWL